MSDDTTTDRLVTLDTQALLKAWRDDYDWAEVFRYAGQGGNMQGDDSPPNPVPPGSGVDVRPFGIDDVATVIGYLDGEHDERDWIVYGRLTDGRWFALRAGCDYTGWDCQAGGSADVAASLGEIIQFGLTDDERERFGVTLPGPGNPLFHGVNP